MGTLNNSKLTIPKKISVGFVNRKGTYTGKLAYIIYTDEKGVLRKEKSWNDWRDHKIPPTEFDNVPTSGFVLNKKAGDYGSGWHHRKASIRIYDPRDFEFEISIENHLFILEETSSIKGKGLEGEFVYSWDGADLVLLPVSSQEYKNSSVHTDLQTKKVTAKEIKEGCLYLNKDNEQMLYLGRHNWYAFIEKNYTYRTFELQGKLHIFVSVDGKSTYWAQKGFTKLAAKLGDEPSPSFAEEFEKFKKSVHSIPPTLLVSEPHRFSLQDFAGKGEWASLNSFYLKKKDNFYHVEIIREHEEDEVQQVSDTMTVAVKSKPSFYLLRDTSATTFKKGKLSTRYGNECERSISQENLEKMDLHTLYLQNEKGSRIPVKDPYYDEDDDFDDDY